MSIANEGSERIEMNRRERDRLKVLYGVIQRERSQKEAARLLRLTTRQVRRLVRRIQASGDQGLIHRLRGRASNRRLPAELRQQVVAAYQRCYQGFGPTDSFIQPVQNARDERIRSETWLTCCGRPTVLQ